MSSKGRFCHRTDKRSRNLSKKIGNEEVILHQNIDVIYKSTDLLIPTSPPLTPIFFYTEKCIVIRLIIVIKKSNTLHRYYRKEIYFYRRRGFGSERGVILV